jgi:hypothetical protein
LHQTGVTGEAIDEFSVTVAAGALPRVAAGSGLVTHARGILRRDDSSRTGTTIGVSAACWRVRQTGVTGAEANGEFAIPITAGALAVISALAGKGTYRHAQGENNEKCSE